MAADSPTVMAAKVDEEPKEQNKITKEEPYGKHYGATESQQFRISTQVLESSPSYYACAIWTVSSFVPLEIL